MKRWLVLAAVPGVVTVVLPVALLAAVDHAASQDQAGSVTCSAPAVGQFTAEQTSIAAAAAKVADLRHLPARAKLVILAAGFQESDLRNLPYGDRDSLGWLQQRANWGTAAERLDPATAAGKFYDALVKIAGWESMPVTVAAQTVQVSAFPDAYAKWEVPAAALLTLLGAGNFCTSPQGGGPVPTNFDHLGNPHTVAEAISWEQAHMPTGNGVPVVGGCERWVTLAYGWPGGYPTAVAHWDAPGSRVLGYSAPPRGALVFWRTGNPAGHVALSLGNGMVISTDFDGTRYSPGRVAAGPITAIDAWGPRLGWRAPSFRSSL